MSRRHPYSCRNCGIDVETAGHISATGLCPTCSFTIEVANIEALREKRGPQYSHWLRRLHMATRRQLIALEQDGQ